MATLSSNGRFGIAAIGARVLFSLFIVFATYNPGGRSYYHWILAEGSFLPRVIVGLTLLGIYASVLLATWEVIGFSGIFLVGTICVSIAWWAEILGLIDLSNQVTLGVLICVMVAMVIAWGMSFAFIFTRVSGILHTRSTIN